MGAESPSGVNHCEPGMGHLPPLGPSVLTRGVERTGVEKAREALGELSEGDRLRGSR